MQLYGWKPRSLGHHATKFGGHRDCGSGVIAFLNHHVISQDHKIKGL